MANYIDIKDFEFITPEKYSEMREHIQSPCIVRMCVYNDNNHSILDKTVYILIKHNDLSKIKECLAQIKDSYYSYAKSFSVDILAKQ